MSHLEILQPFKKYTRRRFLSAGAVAAIVVAREGIAIPGEKSKYNKIESPLPHIPAFDKNPPMLIAHRSGNSPEGIMNAALGGFSFAELDWCEFDGENYGSHAKNWKIGPLKFSTDTNPYSVRLGNPYYTFDQLAGFALSRNVGIYTDLKRGNIDRYDVKKKYGLAARLGIPMRFHSNEIKKADEALFGIHLVHLEIRNEWKGKEPPNLPSPLDLVDYVPETEGEWNRIFDEHNEKPRRIVHTTARDSMQRLPEIIKRNMKIIVGDIVDMRDAEILCNTGAVVGFFNEPHNLRALFPDRTT